MANPKNVAKKLWGSFMTNGNFTLAGDRTSAAAAATGGSEYMEDLGGFADLQVHSVGYDPGTDDEDEDERDPCVYIYLVRGTKKLISSLPEEYKGVQVAVHQVGKTTVRPILSAKQHSPHMYKVKGKIACGSSCAPTGVGYAGTLGALVRDGNEEMLCLSNNHIFGDCNHMPVGTPIMSPSNKDGSARLPAPVGIARFLSLVPMTSGNPNYVPKTMLDVGVGKVIDEALVTSWQGNEDEGYDTPNEVASPHVGMRVRKIGRTTGLTLGEVQSHVLLPMAVPFVSEHFKATVWFEDVWVVAAIGEHFALPGDSGSLVVTEDGEYAVGLLFAANPNGSFAWFVPLERVLDTLSLSLVSGH